MSAQRHHGLAPACRLPLLVVSSLLLACACSAPPTLPESAGVGPMPVLPEPTEALIPAAQIARAVGWQLAGAGVPSAERITLLRDTTGKGQ